MRSVARTFVAACVAFTVTQCAGSNRPDFDGPTPSLPNGDLDASCVGKRRCSRDRHLVLDACGATEQVLEECPSDQGCREGACVPACEATEGADSVGCAFRAVPPEGEVTNACFAVFVSNTWGTPARLELEFGGQALDVARSARIVGPPNESEPITYLPLEGDLPPGQTALLFLAEGPPAGPTGFHIGCPEGTTPAVTTQLGVGGTGRRQSFGLRSSAPVTAYAIYPYGGASSFVTTASLLLPVRSWGTDYVVVSPWERMLAPSFGRRSPGLQIVATEDATTVTVHARADVAGRNDVGAIPAGSSATYMLSAGEVLQFVQQLEIDGSVVSADKPVGYWATHECMYIPSTRPACDMSSTQLAPTTAWGTRYATSPPPSRGTVDETPWRLVAARGGTRLTYRPHRPVDAPEVLEGGQVALFTTTDPFVVESQDGEHPIAMYGYMRGGSTSPRELGDPEMVPIIPTDQYLDRYVFFVDPTFSENAVVVVRTKHDGSFPEVTLDCLGKVQDFRAIDDAHELTIVRFGTRPVPGETECGVGRHEITGTGPFAITVWGMGLYASYGYPGGMGLRQLNTVRPDVPR